MPLRFMVRRSWGRLRKRRLAMPIHVHRPHESRREFSVRQSSNIRLKRMAIAQAFASLARATVFGDGSNWSCEGASGARA